MGQAKPKGIFERPKGSGIWWIRFWRNGQERRRKIGSQEQALAAYRCEKSSEGGISTMSGLIDDYLANHPELASHSHASHGRHFRDYFGGLSVQEAAQGLEAWRSRRLQQVSTSTVRHQMRFLAKVLARGVEKGLLARNPLGRDGLRAPRANPPKSRVLSAIEETRLLAACSQEDRDHLRFLLLTGLRRGELAALRWQDVREETLVVSRGGRSGKTRALWLRPEAREILARRQASGLEAPFPRAVPWCASRLYAVARAAGVEDVTAHVLRHSFATRLLEATGDLMAVHSALGHASLDMTKRYLNMTNMHLQKAMEKADNL